VIGRPRSPAAPGRTLGVHRSSRLVLGMVPALVMAPSVLLGVPTSVTAAAAAEPAPRTPIEHVVVLMQGDRTFDNYFGTYPGADGIPAGTCQVFVRAKPANGCVKPFPVGNRAMPALAPGESVLGAQFDRGKMDGFVSAYVTQGRDGTAAMGYYTRRELPFSWAAADEYVLFDAFFASAFHGTRDNRSFWVSAAPAPSGTGRGSLPAAGYGNQPTIFDRLQAAGVSWKFYVQDYDPRQTFRSAGGTPGGQPVRVPLLNYPRFLDDPRLSAHIVDLSQYYRDLTAGRLPSVAYVATSGAIERSSRSIPAAQNLVRDLTTQLMVSPYWRTSAFLWTYDGSGGWYDHVPPPRVRGAQLGFRVPALMISPYARRGHIEHTRLDYTSVLRFLEDNWGLTPLTPRDRTAASIADGFDFTRPPRAPALISPASATGGPVVEVRTAYGAYGLAAGTAMVVFALAFLTPWLRRGPLSWIRSRLRPRAEAAR